MSLKSELSIGKVSCSVMRMPFHAGTQLRKGRPQEWMLVLAARLSHERICGFKSSGVVVWIRDLLNCQFLQREPRGFDQDMVANQIPEIYEKVVVSSRIQARHKYS